MHKCYIYALMLNNLRIFGTRSVHLLKLLVDKCVITVFFAFGFSDVSIHTILTLSRQGQR